MVNVEAGYVVTSAVILSGQPSVCLPVALSVVRSGVDDASQMMVAKAYTQQLVQINLKENEKRRMRSRI